MNPEDVPEAVVDAHMAWLTQERGGEDTPFLRALARARLATEVTPGGSLGTGRLTAIHTRPTPNDPDETIGLYLHLGDLHLNQHTPDGPERHQEPRTPLPVPRDITHSDTPTPESN